MKRLLISLTMVLAAWTGAKAMSYEMAREEALYLTDKMAYELNLNDQQYNDAYEINLDYLMSLNTADDIAGQYLDWRAADLRAILYDWQWSLFIGADYFLRPVLWRANAWFFPIYRIYDRHYFFYDRPHVYLHYRGGHSHLYFHDHGFYSDRRPHWRGGLRGHDRGAITRTPGMGAPRIGGEMRGGQITHRGGRSGNSNRQGYGEMNRRGNSDLNHEMRPGGESHNGQMEQSNSTRSGSSRGHSAYGNRDITRSQSISRGSSSERSAGRSYQGRQSRNGNSFNYSSTRTPVDVNRGSSARSYQNHSSRSSSSISGRGGSSISGRSSSSMSSRGSSIGSRGGSSMGTRGGSSMGSRGSSFGGGSSRGGGGSMGGGSHSGGRGGRGR